MIIDRTKVSQEDSDKNERYNLFFKKIEFFSCTQAVKSMLYMFQIRRGGRVADCAGLLNRCRDLNPYREFESHPLRI